MRTKGTRAEEMAMSKSSAALKFIFRMLKKPPWHKTRTLSEANYAVEWPLAVDDVLDQIKYFMNLWWFWICLEQRCGPASKDSTSRRVIWPPPYEVRVG